MEEWKSIEGYEGLYEVSNLGNIRSLPRNGTVPVPRTLKVSEDKDGYGVITLRNANRCTKRAHRLVAKAFIPNPDNKPQINHKDGNKLNNNVHNLEWATGSENILHAKRLGLQAECPNRKRVRQIDEDSNVVAEFQSMREAEKITGIHWTGISAVTRGIRNTAGGCSWEVI